MATSERVNDLFRYIKERVDTRRVLDVEDFIKLENGSLASQIKFYRKKKKLTQKELAQKLDVCTDCIKRYEREKRKQINVDLTKRLIEVLGIKDKVKLTEYMEFALNEPHMIIKNFLEVNNMTGVDLAKLMNKNPHVVHRWIRGDHVMTERNFLRFKKILEERNFNIKVNI